MTFCIFVKNNLENRLDGRNVTLKKLSSKTTPKPRGGGGLAPPKTCQTTAKTLWKIGLQNQTVRRVCMWALQYWLNLICFWSARSILWPLVIIAAQTSITWQLHALCIVTVKFTVPIPGSYRTFISSGRETLLNNFVIVHFLKFWLNGFQLSEFNCINRMYQNLHYICFGDLHVHYCIQNSSKSCALLTANTFSRNQYTSQFQFGSTTIGCVDATMQCYCATINATANIAASNNYKLLHCHIVVLHTHIVVWHLLCSIPRNSLVPRW